MYGLQGTLDRTRSRNSAYARARLCRPRANPIQRRCRLYVVSEVPAEPDAIDVFEVWDDKAAHDASLQLERVRATIAKARPLIAGMGESVELRPVGGQGLD